MARNDLVRLPGSMSRRVPTTMWPVLQTLTPTAQPLPVCAARPRAAGALLAWLAGLLLTSAALAQPAGTAGPARPAAPASAAAALTAELAEGRHDGITAFHLSVGDETVAAYTAPALAASAPDLRSATKSITALLVGIALAQGDIPSLKSRVGELLPPALRKPFDAEPRKAAMTVQDLLTMRSGLDCDDWTPGSPGHEDTMYNSRDWLAFWAAVPARSAPGEQFAYCTGNVIALGALIARGSGMALDAYAQARLFEPLGIGSARWDRYNGGQGVDAGGHLRLQPADLARIGQLVLHGGQWHGRQVVPRAWIDAMTMGHSDVPGRKQRYGYLWWIDETSQPALPRTRVWLAWGNGGNFLVVMPELQAVAAFTGTRFNRADALQPLGWLRDRILPGMRAGTGQ